MKKTGGISANASGVDELVQLLLCKFLYLENRSGLTAALDISHLNTSPGLGRFKTLGL